MTYFNSKVLSSGQAATCMRKRRFAFRKGQLSPFLLAIAMLLSAISSFSQNPIVVENAKPGSPASEWDVFGNGDLSIQGFSTDISVNRGSTVKFKIKTDAPAYKIQIYRLGYYQGNGARYIADGTVTAALPQSQPTDLYDLLTGKTDCSNWSESAKWDVPATAVSGFYVAKLTRLDTYGSSHIYFIVRNDQQSSNLLYKTSDATWQAYNDYGGNSLYVNNSGIPILGYNHATKVSYNRPFIIRNGNDDFHSPFNAEYPMIRWLERNGYDMTYTTDVDMVRNTDDITPSKYKVLMSVGHDEYWSQSTRDKFEKARIAGVHLAFFSGNEAYWRVRWEDNTRTLVCYKEGVIGELACGSKCDPLAGEWTGLWRDGCGQAGVSGVCKPENSLSGQISWIQVDGAIQVPSAYKNLRLWRNTAVSSLADGQVATFAYGTLGYEWDYEQYSASYPRGRVTMSSTTLNNQTHKLSLYKHPSGALVFGAGTVQWSWGLDSKHDRGSAPEDKNMQQATVNLFADMGVQPGSLQSNLIKASQSTDNTPPVSVINLSTLSDSITQTSTVKLTGTASDAGGVVAGIEVSFDNGATWKLANGTTNWSIDWIPNTLGTVVIKTRAVDDIGNLESIATATNTVTVTVKPAECPCSIFTDDDVPTFELNNDGSPIEVGVKFRVNEVGLISGIRYYKGSGTSGSHIGHLWTSTGTMITAATFINETESGWQQVVFATPVAVLPGVTYVASVFSSTGDFALSNPYFDESLTRGPVTALGNGVDGPNGVYIYTQSPAYPTENYLSSNYWIDVVFKRNALFEIVDQPRNIDVCLGSSASFSVKTLGGTNPTIKWQTSTDGITWKDISGATSELFTIPATTIADNGKKVRALVTANGITLTSSVGTLTVNQIIPIVFNKTNASCTNGTITMSQTGGTAPYKYSLNGGPFQSSSTFGDLSQGIYSVTIKDAKGCTATVSNIVITQVSFLNTILLSKNDASCSNDDGSLFAFAYFGSYPYQYSINGSDYQSSGYFSELPADTYTVYVKDAKGCTDKISNIVVSQPAPIKVSLSSKTNESCYGNDGSVTISASGGVSPYKYSINGGSYQSSNTFGGLKAGTYTVTVKDYKGCTNAVSDIKIVQTTSLSASISAKVDTRCGESSGSISVSVSGGTSPYTYILSNGTYQSSNTFNNLDADVYAVWVVDAKKCYTYISNIVISQVSTLDASVTASKNASCKSTDGYIAVTATGGKAPYQYSINGGRYQYGNSFTNLAAGKYDVTVKDYKGCTKTISSFEIKSLPFVISVGKITGESCFGNDATIDINQSGGTGPYRYSINGGYYFSDSDDLLTRLSAGTYKITAKDSKDCVASISNVVVPNNKLTATVTKTNACSNMNNGTITVNVQGGTAPFQYSMNGFTYKSGNLFTGLAPSTYFVIIKDAKGCITYVSGISISRSSTPCHYRGSGSDEEVTKNKSVNPEEVIAAEPAAVVFPNPTSGVFNVQVTGLSGVVTVRIVDALGKEIDSKQVTVVGDRTYVPFNLGGKAKGVYHVSISSGTQTVSQKVVVQ